MTSKDGETKERLSEKIGRGGDGGQKKQGRYKTEKEKRKKRDTEKMG